MLESVLASSSIWLIFLCLGCSLIFGFLIAFIYKRVSVYSKNFLVTISVLPMLVSSIIIMVNGNLGTSVATLGAFSLVRFRSMPGNSKEILVVFLAMAVGLATGMGHLTFAFVLTVLGMLSLVIFTNLKFFDKNKYEKVLKVLVPENLDYTSMFDDIFLKYTDKVDLESVKTTNMGSLFDLSYNILLKKDINEKEFIDELRVRNGNLKIILTHPIMENEL